MTTEQAPQEISGGRSRAIWHYLQRHAFPIIVALISSALCIFQLYTAGIRTPNLFYQRGIHLLFILVLTFLIFPAQKKAKTRNWGDWLLDSLYLLGSLYAGGYLVLNLDAIIERAGFWTAPDYLAGLVMIVVLLEACRRVVGQVITGIAVVAMLYAMAGPRGSLSFIGEFLPGILEHRGKDVTRVIENLYLGQEGIFGLPLGVAATYVFIFILFGACLEVTGGGKFFIDLAYALAGRQRGGPAKVSVIASGLMGSISGSAIANVVTSGAFTIPLMKKLGYKPSEAGGVEAAASTGGQIMPPVMGAGAFLIAEYTGISYLEVVKMSILPAIMYFATVYLFVDVIAAKRGMKGLPRADLPKIGAVLRDGWHFLIPLIVLIALLLRNYSPARVGFIAIGVMLVVSALRSLWRFYRRPQAIENADDSNDLEQLPAQSLGQLCKQGYLMLLRTFEIAARNAIPVSLACAVAGVVVGVIGLTGLGSKFSGLMLSFSQGNLLLALLMVALASLVLGMGLPVTASYIVLAVLTAPALQQDFGIPIIIAHLLIFWYSQDSNVTPPVALAAFAGAGIAQADPMATGVQAWKFAKGLYLIPLFMVLKPEIVLGGAPLLVGWHILTACASMAAFVFVLEGYLFTHMRWTTRLIGVAALVASLWTWLPLQIVGVGLVALVFWFNYQRHRNVQE